MFKSHNCAYAELQEIQTIDVEEYISYRERIEKDCSRMKQSFLFLPNKIIKHVNTFTMRVNKNAFHLFLIPVFIQNHKYKFVVDTGAQISGILDVHKHKLQVKEMDVDIGIKSASGQQKKRSMIQVKHLFFGGVEVCDSTLVVLEEKDFQIPFIKKDMVHFDGILGWDILSQIDFELDDEMGYFRMIHEEEVTTNQNLIPGMFPVVTMKNEVGKTCLFGLDSGAEESWLSNLYCEENGLQMSDDKKRFTIGVHGFEKVALRYVSQCLLRFYKSEILLENTRTGETKVYPTTCLDGILGNEIFRGKKIQFLNSKGIVRIL